MYHQKRATLNPPLFKAAEAGTTNNPMSLTVSPSGENDGTQGQSKREASKQYIPVYRIELYIGICFKRAFDGGWWLGGISAGAGTD
jgi:hypothetical protein